jgi:hypothetical protein
MHRSPWLSILLVLAMLVTPLAVLSVPSVAHAAEPDAPAATADDEIIVLTSSLQIRVDDPNVAPGNQSAAWNSGSDTGYTALAAGDVNGDGDAEIAAVRGGLVRIFDPWVPTGGTSASGNITLPAGQSFRYLLALADFDRDGKSELATLNTVNNISGIVESLKIWDGGATGTAWNLVFQDQFGYNWSDMTTGDFNNDGFADLSLIRYATSPNVTNLIKIWSGANWGALGELSVNTGTPLRAEAGGNISNVYGGSELAVSRYVPNAAIDGVLALRLNGSSIVDLVPDRVENRKFNPEFRSIATGDLNGDGDDEIVMARDPINAASTSVLMLNPNGVAMNPFEVAIGAGASAFRSVRTGDIDGDGKDEIVVIRPDVYATFYQPELNTAYTSAAGPFYVGAGGVTNYDYMTLANVDGSGRVSGPTLSVTPNTFSITANFGQDIGSRTIQVTNSGTSTPISWQAQVDGSPAWLSISKTSGTTPDSFSVTFKSYAVNPGQYSARVIVTATTAGVFGSPQYVNVSLNLKDAGFVVQPTSVVLFQPTTGPTVKAFVNIYKAGGNVNWVATALPDAAAVDVVELDSAGRLTVEGATVMVDGTAVPPPSWLVFTPDHGTTNPPTKMEISVAPGTPSGTYQAVIFIVGQDPNLQNRFQTVEVRAVVAPSFKYLHMPYIAR